MTNQHQDSISIINDQIILVKKDVIISLFQEQKIIIIYAILKFFGSIIDFVCDKPGKLINNLTPLAAHLVSWLHEDMMLFSLSIPFLFAINILWSFQSPNTTVWMLLNVLFHVRRLKRKNIIFFTANQVKGNQNINRGT